MKRKVFTIIRDLLCLITAQAHVIKKLDKKAVFSQYWPHGESVDDIRFSRARKLLRAQEDNLE